MTVLSTAPDLTDRPGSPAGSGGTALPGDTAVLRTSLREGVTVTSAGEVLSVGGARTGRLPVRNSPAARTVLRLLGGRALSDTELAVAVTADAGEGAIFDLQMLLARLAATGLLQHEVTGPAGRLARLHAVGTGPVRVGGRLPADRQVRLSRTAQISAVDGVLVARAPRSHLALDLDHGLGGLLPALATTRTVEELEGLLPELPSGAVQLALRLCLAAQQLAGPDEETPGEQQWSATDLWLHAHTRSPRTVSGYGGTYVGRGRRRPEPASPGPRWAEGVDLPVPDLAAIAAADPRLTDVLENRRSRRLHDDGAPITLAQLGELLYRAARLRRTSAGSDGEEAADRPYPSGGAVHELELYPLVTRCQGLPAGLYHYRGDVHRLELVTADDAALAGLVGRARASAVMPSDPQVVLLVTARFGRVMFKYETIAYSLVLKHVGVLYQTVYLVAAAMGLAVCGLGGGDAEAFAAASGLDWYTEGTVGELVLGSARPGPDPAGGWAGEVPTS